MSDQKHVDECDMGTALVDVELSNRPVSVQPVAESPVPTGADAVGAEAQFDTDVITKEAVQMRLPRTDYEGPIKTPPKSWFFHALYFVHTSCVVLGLEGRKSVLIRDDDGVRATLFSRFGRESAPAGAEYDDICYGECKDCEKCCLVSTHYDSLANVWRCPNPSTPCSDAEPGMVYRPHHHVFTRETVELVRPFTDPVRHLSHETRECVKCFPYGYGTGDQHVLPLTTVVPPPKRRVVGPSGSGVSASRPSPIETNEGQVGLRALSAEELRALSPEQRAEYVRAASGESAQWAAHIDKQAAELSKEMSMLAAQTKVMWFAFYIPAAMTAVVWGAVGLPFGLGAALLYYSSLGSLRVIASRFPLWTERVFGTRAMVYLNRVWEWTKPLLVFTSFMFLGYLLAKYLIKRSRTALKKESKSAMSDSVESFAKSIIVPTLKLVAGAGAAFAVLDRVQNWITDYEVQDDVHMRYNRGKEMCARVAGVLGEKLTEPVVRELFSAKFTELQAADAACVTAGLSVASKWSAAKERVSTAAAAFRGKAQAVAQEAGAKAKDEFDEACESVTGVWTRFKEHLKQYSFYYSTAGALVLGVLVGIWIHYMMEVLETEKKMGLTPEAASYALSISDKQKKTHVRVGWEDATGKFHHKAHGFVNTDKIVTIWHWIEDLAGVTSICVIGPDGSRHKLPLIDKNEAEDWAICARPSNMKGVTPVNFAKSRVKVNDNVAHIRFANLHDISDRSLVTAYKQVVDVRDDVFGCMDNTVAGDCGSPVFDKAGDVVGYHVAGSDGLQWAHHVTDNLKMACSKPVQARSGVGAVSATSNPTVKEGVMGAVGTIGVVGSMMMTGPFAAPVAAASALVVGADALVEQQELHDRELHAERAKRVDKTLALIEKSSENDQLRQEVDYLVDIVMDQTSAIHALNAKITEYQAQYYAMLQGRDPGTIVGLDPKLRTTVDVLGPKCPPLQNLWKEAVGLSEKVEKSLPKLPSAQKDEEKVPEAQQVRNRKGKGRVNKAGKSDVSPGGKNHQAQREAKKEHDPNCKWYIYDDYHQYVEFLKNHSKCNHPVAVMEFDTWDNHRKGLHKKKNYDADKCDWCSQRPDYSAGVAVREIQKLADPKSSVWPDDSLITESVEKDDEKSSVPKPVNANGHAATPASCPLVRK